LKSHKQKKKRTGQGENEKIIDTEIEIHMFELMEIKHILKVETKKKANGTTENRNQKKTDSDRPSADSIYCLF
jgi:ribosomal protein L24